MIRATENQSNTPIGTSVNTPIDAPSYSADFAAVASAEQQWLQQRRAAAGGIAAEAPTVGLALSGGGIRSASFNLGVLQALQRKGLLSRIDYLSSVSGGGYVASCLSWLRSQFPFSARQEIGSLPLASGHGSVLDWLRAHGSYLISGRGFSGWALAGSILAGTLLNLIVLLPLFLLLIGGASRDWIALSWPASLHLPGAHALTGHDGFMLLVLAGVAAWLLYLLAMLVFALSTVLPPLRRLTADFFFRRLFGRLLAIGVIGLAAGLLPVFTGIEETVMRYVRVDGAGEIARHLSYLLPMLGGATAMWRANKSGAGTVAVIGLGLLLYSFFTLLYHLANHTELMSSSLFVGWCALSLVLAMVVDINGISMHSYYRGRLAEAYLPVVKTADADTSTRLPLQFRLAELSPQSGSPLHLINTTLNTTSSNQEKLRSRNGENMVLSALYCGSTSTGFRRTQDYLNGGLTLSTAFSVSGAAVDPDMYATKARPISFLMSLLNIRLGIWTLNPRTPPRKLRLPAWYQLILREMLGVGLAETQKHIHLADGGHFENLGVYELLRRNCRYIIVSDAGADPDCTLADLGKAVQRARADFNVEVDIDADRFYRERGEALRQQVHVLGNIRYADGSTGRLLYLKAMLSDKLSADIYGYWRSNPAFPNQSTADQFYDEQQFDAYRELGLQLMWEILGTADKPTIEALFDRASELNAMNAA
ncbi:patatin-like phospholipase family protein [Permianibacter fluminis]|uniref:patatin-like phospholipase family protein n=1 Tax=Permianibacter fluminis TaxID=2738515 RepID=UPI0038B39E32